MCFDFCYLSSQAEGAITLVWRRSLCFLKQLATLIWLPTLKLYMLTLNKSLHETWAQRPVLSHGWININLWQLHYSLNPQECINVTITMWIQIKKIYLQKTVWSKIISQIKVCVRHFCKLHIMHKLKISQHWSSPGWMLVSSR